jgi:hypothetical protein
VVVDSLADLILLIIQGRRPGPSPPYFSSLRDAANLKTSSLRVLVHLGLAALLLVLRTRALSRHGSLQLGRFGHTLALLALFRLLGDLRSVLGVVVGQALLLARRLVGALGLLFAGIGLRGLAKLFANNPWIY